MKDARHTKPKLAPATAVFTFTVNVVAPGALIHTELIPDAVLLVVSVSCMFAAFGVNPSPCVIATLVFVVVISPTPWVVLANPIGFPATVMSVELL